jgi:hypothetical protein
MSLPNSSDRYPEWVTESSTDGAAEHNFHIFGPYRGDYQDILESLAQFLRDNGYTGATLCSELPDHHRPAGMSKGEQNWWESVNCMYNADAAIFLILEPLDARLNGKPKEGLNSSVFAEITYWMQFFAHRKQGTLIVYEGDMTEVGSLISGLVEIGDCTDFTIETGELDKLRNFVLTTCVEWVQ